MSHFSPNTEMPFKGANSPNMGFSWCNGIMTLKSNKTNSHEDKNSKITLTKYV